MSPAGGEDVVSLLSVGFMYKTPAGTISALRDITLDFAPGTSTAVVGRSGSGKSTLVSILALLRRPSEGAVRMWGVDASNMNDIDLARLRGENIGVVFQSFHLDPAAKALENILLPWYFQDRIPYKVAERRARDKLDLLGIGDLATRHVGEMSGGQRQRVAVARALLLNPRLLIADEPTGNLDEDTAADIAGQLFGLVKESCTTVVVVTHDPEIASMADRIVHLSVGRVDGGVAR